jgi:hypothetical protein
MNPIIESVLAETFTDIEAFEGTCYKAAAWQPCGITKGFTREHRCDYFFRNERPKKLWLRVLHRQAGPMLRAIEMPPEYAAGLMAVRNCGFTRSMR